MRLSAILLVLPLSALAQTDVTTAAYDNTRQGYNSTETVLTPSNVLAGKFGRLGSWTLDAPICVEPLYVSSAHTLYVATTGGTMYALDASHPGSAPIWSTNLGAPVAGLVGGNNCNEVSTGVSSTPVIDKANGWIFAVNRTTGPVFKFNKLNLSTGSIITATTISGSVTGTGQTVNSVPDDTTGPNLNFHAAWEYQRTPMTLQGGKVYFGFGSLNEGATPWHGWVFSYDEITATQSAIWCSTPNGFGGGVWPPIGGIAGDGTSLFLLTGNGTYDGSGSSDYSQSLIKLNSSLALQGSLTASDNADTSDVDSDQAASHVMIVGSGNYLTYSGKDGIVRVQSKSHLCGLIGAGGCTQDQAFQGSPSWQIPTSASTGVFGGSFANGVGYFPISQDATYAYTFNGTSYTTTPLAYSAMHCQFSFSSVSSNSGSAPILWQLCEQPSPPYLNQAASGQFAALNPSTMETYWMDVIGAASRWVAPMVADGKVYVASQSVMYQFGSVK